MDAPLPDSPHSINAHATMHMQCTCCPPYYLTDKQTNKQAMDVFSVLQINKVYRDTFGLIYVYMQQFMIILASAYLHLFWLILFQIC